MPDIRLDVEFFDHPKTIKLERRLGLEGVRSLLRLWMWSAKNRPEGVLSNMDSEDVEIAANWTGETGAFVDAALSLRWLDQDQDGFRLHNWQERNGWVAGSTERGDRARFSRMAATHPEIYATMAAQGIDSITKADYTRITRGNNESSTVVNAALTPPPPPYPTPTPNNIDDSPEEVKNISENVDNQPDIEAEAIKALRVYHSFKRCRCRPGDQDLLWIVSLYQNHQINVCKCFQEAKRWADRKGLDVKNPRAFLTEWLKNLRK